MKPSFLEKGPTTMEKPSSYKTELTVLRNYFWILLVLRSVLVGSIPLCGLFHEKREAEELAHTQERSKVTKAKGSVKTIETYRAHIKEKLNLTDAAELLQHAIQWVNSRDRG